MRKMILCGMFFVIMLMCSEIRVNANDMCSCGGNHGHTIVNQTFAGYKNYTSYHAEVWNVVLECNNCHKLENKREERNQGHSLYGHGYDDLGHMAGGSSMDGSHMYRFHCVCGYTETRTIPCSASNGVHNTP